MSYTSIEITKIQWYSKIIKYDSKVLEAILFDWLVYELCATPS